MNVNEWPLALLRWKRPDSKPKSFAAMHATHAEQQSILNPVLNRDGKVTTIEKDFYASKVQWGCFGMVQCRA